MQDPLLDCEEDIRDYLAEHTTTQCPPLLAQAMEYAVFPGGARVRPQLCMAVALANNSSDRPLAAAAATAVEFLHCASLVHDDLPCFDDATERRGKPSVHAKFGERIAVLTGSSVVVSSETAGCKSLVISVILPSSKLSHAAFIAPQLEWPMTTIIFDPRYLHEYSKLPIAFLHATFPAKRTLKTSPRVWSKIVSGAVLESLQPRIAAKGC